MKKLLLLSFVLSLSLGSFAQNKVAPAPKLKVVLTPEQLKNGAVKRLDVNETGSVPINGNVSRNLVRPSHVAPAYKMGGVSFTTIGATHYDLQTNEAISNRLLVNSDGTISAAWTTAPAPDASQGYPDRGTGYNYFDGTNWVVPAGAPTPRIEGYRTGFTNIVVTASGKELAITHSSTSTSLNTSYRPAKGTGTWTDDSTLLGSPPNLDTWAKAIAGGALGENVYVIVNGSGVGTASAPAPTVAGQAGPLFYARSTDGGATFPTYHAIIPGLDSSFYNGFGGDDYSIDAAGDTVAIVIGDWGTDLILMKSTDGGVTFTKTIVEPTLVPQPYNPYTTPFPDLNLDGVPDTLQVPAGDAHVMIDNNGMCHVFYTKVLALNDQGAGFSYFPNALDGLLYWNESFGSNPPVLIAETPDYNANGTLDLGSGGTNGAGNYRGSLMEKPSSGIDANGTLYVAFQTANETTDTTVFATTHKHVYMIGSTDNGVTWTLPVDIMKDVLGGEFMEGVFACVAKNVGTCVSVIYQQDEAPGHALATANSEEHLNNQGPSDIVYGCVPVAEALGISTPATIPGVSVTCAPNPAADHTVITISADRSINVDLSIVNTLGQVMYTQESQKFGAGQHNLTINTSVYPAGVYFYTVSYGNQKITNKLVVK